MPPTLYLAPATAGKTAYIIEQARRAAANLAEPVRVIVPSSLQAQALKQRLADAGGGLGIIVQLFDELYRTCLAATASPTTELPEPVQFRLLQQVANETDLTHYASIRRAPGFISLLQSRLAEFKAAGITPAHLATAVEQLGGQAPLIELARLYTAYQRQLEAHRWTDRPGLGWLARDILTNPALPPVFANQHLFVDGFDSFTPTQLQFLAAVAGQSRQLVITLTGVPNDHPRPLAHRRFHQTRQQVEAALSVTAQPLPAPPSPRLPTLAHLEAHLFEPPVAPVPADTTLSLIKAPDRPAEVRAALRWLKARIVHDGLHPAQTALLARDIAPYRPAIRQIGAEFGLPLRLVDGLPLSGSPVIAALLNLLRLTLPGAETPPKPALPYRAVLDAWRSPFFDWSTDLDPDLTAADARQLDALARQQQVTGGLNQWQTAFDTAARSDAACKDIGLTAADLAGMRHKFDQFVRRLTPPPEAESYLTFTAWLEDLIGPDSASTGRLAQPDPGPAISLRLIERVRAGGGAAENLAALQQLKGLLRSLVWAEHALALAQPVTYLHFVEELAGLIEASFYTAAGRPDAILVADVPQVRGLSLAAVAVLGLAEGEFPASLSEDPLLPEADRRRLIALGLPLKLALDSAEAEYFYETVTRARQSLLLTRPRLADNGAEWPASSFWEAARRLVTVKPQTLPQDSLPPLTEVASGPELLAVLTAFPPQSVAWRWLTQTDPARRQTLETSLAVLAQRLGECGSYNGHLARWIDHFAADFGPAYVWSASQLESYLTCPFMFFTQRVLGVEPRGEPAAGLEAHQLGSLYHRLLEEVYAAAPNPIDLDGLLAALDTVVAAILDNAPAEQGFRATAWWQHTRQEIVAKVRASLAAFVREAEQSSPERCFIPVAREVWFGDDPPFAIETDDDAFYLRGVIDRIDRNPAGEFRIIDYKIAGPAGFKKTALHREGKLQLPLYAMAARDALGMGQLADGFYWHAQHAQPSEFSLRDFQDDDFGHGPDGAIALAVTRAWGAVIGARSGHFAPQPPPGGCPAYCPAAAFCWGYRPQGW